MKQIEYFWPKQGPLGPQIHNRTTMLQLTGLFMRVGITPRRNLLGDGFSLMTLITKNGERIYSTVFTTISGASWENRKAYDWKH